MRVKPIKEPQTPLQLALGRELVQLEILESGAKLRTEYEIVSLAEMPESITVPETLQILGGSNRQMLPRLKAKQIELKGVFQAGLIETKKLVLDDTDLNVDAISGIGDSDYATENKLHIVLNKGSNLTCSAALDLNQIAGTEAKLSAPEILAESILGQLEIVTGKLQVIFIEAKKVSLLDATKGFVGHSDVNTVVSLVNGRERPCKLTVDPDLHASWQPQPNKVQLGDGNSINTVRDNLTRCAQVEGSHSFEF